MTILTALAAAYDRLAGEGRAPPYPYSRETVHYVISLETSGAVVSVTALGNGEDGKLIDVPQAVKRASGVAPNFLWDKTSYALGVAALQMKGESAGAYAKRTRRLRETHDAFIKRQTEAIAGSDDEGLVALARFLEQWRSDHFTVPVWPDDMRDLNIVFALEKERRAGRFLHNRPAARSLWMKLVESEYGEQRMCLVSGIRGPVARLHPSVSGVRGAQSSGASLVSFNLAAFESYGAKQGDNAQVAEIPTFAYTTALNTLLAKGSRNKVQIGDASTVFWADVSGAPAEMVENIFSVMLQGPELQGPDQDGQDREIAEALELMRLGRADALRADLKEGVRLHVLGLAPNAARLSVRFWLSDEFGRIAAHYARYAQDMAIEPAPNPPLPGFWSLLRVLAPQGKTENVPPSLAGEWLRAVLTGGRYPQTLLATAVMRARVEKDVGARRASIIRAVLRRNHQWEAPVSLDPDNPSQAYQLGRLFAVLEQAQRAALGRVNATIADRYYAAASSTPARVFGPLLRGLRTHVSDAEKRGQGGWIAPKVGQIMLKLAPDLPTSLSLEDQARFAIGYYHEKATRHGKPDAVVDDAQDGHEEASND